MPTNVNKSNEMFVSPQSLRDSCLHFFRQTIDSEATPLESGLSANVAEELLHRLSSDHLLTDDLLLHPLFDSSRTQLTCVRIPDASQLSLRGLRALRGHRLTELSVTAVKKCTINELLGCLGEHSLQRLRALSVSFCSFTASQTKFCVVVGLAKLHQLRALDVSHTDFNGHGLEIVVEDLPLLHTLNISQTRVKDISPLKKCKDRLISLAMYNLRSISGGNEEFVPVLTELRMLHFLDVSEDRDSAQDLFASHAQDCTPDILKHPLSFPLLRGLDISGREVNRQELKRFLELKKSTGEAIEFLGLMQSSIALDDLILTLHSWYDSSAVVTGCATEEQLRHSLRRYLFRSAFVHKSLFHLYNHTLSYSEPRADLIDLIVPAMRRHVKVIGVCMAATACLYNLTKNELGERLHPQTLRQVVDVTLEAMQSFPNHQQLQKNALLTLCSDRILQSVSFDRFRCTRLVLDSLVTFKEVAMNRMAVAICSILAAKVSTQETSHLGANPVYMEALLDIVRQRVVTSLADNDIMLKFTLSALWNLTDESPKTCSMFLSKGGMDLYLRVLQMFSGESAVETKVLGLLNNIAEVSYLRRHLMDDEFLSVLRDLMKSCEIDVSYFAAGIFAHLCSDATHRSYASVDLRQVLDELVHVVLGWKTPEAEMVAYRSFVPFLPLLSCFDAPAVQLWAIWAIHHVCSKNPKRYCEMLVSEDGVRILERIIMTSAAESSLSKYCEETLLVVKKEFPNIC